MPCHIKFETHLSLSTLNHINTMLSRVASRFSSVGKATATNQSKRAIRSYMTHDQLPEEHQMVYEMCRKFADEELAPNAKKWDKEHKLPLEVVGQLVSKKVVGSISCIYNIN